MKWIFAIIVAVAELLFTIGLGEVAITCWDKDRDSAYLLIFIAVCLIPVTILAVRKILKGR